MRLKPYYDPEDRPTNPPDQLLESQEEFDPEELPQTQRNRNEEDRNRNEDTNVQSRGNTENTRRKDDENKVRRKEGQYKRNKYREMREIKMMYKYKKKLMILRGKKENQKWNTRKVSKPVQTMIQRDRLFKRKQMTIQRYTKVNKTKVQAKIH